MQSLIYLENSQNTFGGALFRVTWLLEMLWPSAVPRCTAYKMTAVMTTYVTPTVQTLLSTSPWGEVPSTKGYDDSTAPCISESDTMSTHDIMTVARREILFSPAYVGDIFIHWYTAQHTRVSTLHAYHLQVHQRPKMPFSIA